MARRKGATDVVPSQALKNVCVRIDVDIVVKIDEFEADCPSVDDKTKQRDQAGDAEKQDASSSTIDRLSFVWTQGSVPLLSRRVPFGRLIAERFTGTGVVDQFMQRGASKSVFHVGHRVVHLSMKRT